MTQSAKKKTAAFTLDPFVIAWLKEEAKRLERSRSYIVNRVLKNEIEHAQRNEDSGGEQS